MRVPYWVTSRVKAKPSSEAGAERSSTFAFTRRIELILLAVVYLATSTFCAVNIITRTQASTTAIEHILKTYNMKNEGSLAVDRYAKEHPILGMLFGSPVKKELELPSHDQSVKELSSDVTQDLKTVREESSWAAWWSWSFINLSLFYIVAVIALERSFTARAVLFSLACVSVFCFVIGVLAPAMVIWTAPIIPMASGNLSFVLQHQVRGIAAIIWELLTTGHWVVGGFLLLFSIITPLTKASLTLFATGSHSKTLNFKIGEFLHSIGKWSMADVFVAGVLLSLFALKAQEATKSIPCLGLYYFIGYCMLSMTTTELLARSGIVATPHSQLSDTKLHRGVIGGLLVGVLCFVLATGAYTYQQYTANTHEKVEASTSPQNLNNADLVLPAHKQDGGGQQK